MKKTKFKLLFFLLILSINVSAKKKVSRTYTNSNDLASVEIEYKKDFIKFSEKNKFSQAYTNSNDVASVEFEYKKDLKIKKLKDLKKKNDKEEGVMHFKLKTEKEDLQLMLTYEKFDEYLQTLEENEIEDDFYLIKNLFNVYKVQRVVPKEKPTPKKEK